MSIDEIHSFLKFLKNDGQGGYFSPPEIDSAINRGSFAKYDEERQQFERTQHVSDNLANFKSFEVITMTAGFGPLPTNYGIVTNASTNANIRTDIVPDSEWVDVLNDPIDIVSVNNPKISIRGTTNHGATQAGVEVQPNTVTAIRMYYLRLPALAAWGYTEVDGDLVYNDGTSVQLDWPSTCHEDITLRAAAYLGVPLTDELLLRLKSFKKQTEGV